MVPVVIQAVGGALVVVSLLVNSGVSNINNHIKQKQQEIQIQIDEELDELKDDYEYCEKIYIKYLIEEGELEEEISEDELNEIKDEYTSIYSREYENRVDISQRTINYMKQRLDKKDVENMEFRSKLSGDSINQQVVNKWLDKFIVK